MTTRLPKYHGLGNDYFVLDPQESPTPLSPETVRQICDRHAGAGSDGILRGPFAPDSADFQLIAGGGSPALCAVRIWNPDGSEAEKSGNGARIFTQYLYDKGMVRRGVPFVFATAGGPIEATVLRPFEAIQCQMGRFRFTHPDFPPQPGGNEIPLFGKDIRYCPVSIGNPHCVVLNLEASRENALRFGPALENAPRFPRRINVQFLQPLDEHDIRIEIWERGAGYTLASGTSSCAAAAAAIRNGFCKSPVTVHAPGGRLTVEIDDAWNARLTGPVAFVFTAIWP